MLLLGSFSTCKTAIAEKITKRTLDVIPREINALVMIEVESHVYTSAVVRRLRGLKQASNVYEITGDFDISMFIKAEDTADLNNLIEEIRTIPGVKSTETRVVLKKYPNGNH